MPDETATDFAVAVYREEGQWEAAPLPPRVGERLQSLIKALRQQPGESGTIGLLSVDEDFFVAVRLVGREQRLLLSDVTAASESPIAQEVLAELELPAPGDADLERVQPAGDLGIFSDIGMSAMELAALCDDLDLYPDEMLTRIASRLGFGERFQRAVDAALS
ncbi:MAG: tRNA adenosine deaminase-associated protein [Streptomycetales bacterium]